MFSGTSNHTIDAKGRIILPQKFRDELGESFYITNGFAENIQVISKEKFEFLRKQISEMGGQKSLILQYTMLGGAVEVTPNAQGRIVIPQKLREDARIDKDVIVVGMDTRVEIWNKEIFEEFIEAKKKEILDDALELLKFE